MLKTNSAKLNLIQDLRQNSFVPMTIEDLFISDEITGEQFRMILKDVRAFQDWLIDRIEKIQDYPND